VAQSVRDLTVSCSLCGADFQKTCRGTQIYCGEKCVNRARHRQQKAKSSARRIAMAAFIKSVKARTPCSDCGLFYPPVVMDFDHRPGEKKSRNVGYMTSAGRAAVEREMAKCDVVCSNCHRLRTQQRFDARRSAA
jgi:hypothetical protein